MFNPIPILARIFWNVHNLSTPGWLHIYTHNMIVYYLLYKGRQVANLEIGRQISFILCWKRKHLFLLGVLYIYIHIDMGKFGVLVVACNVGGCVACLWHRFMAFSRNELWRLPGAQFHPNKWWVLASHFNIPILSQFYAMIATTKRWLGYHFFPFLKLLRPELFLALPHDLWSKPTDGLKVG
jgi:hypothetical protein